MTAHAGKGERRPRKANAPVLGKVAASVERRTAKKKGRRRAGEINYGEIERMLIHGELRQLGDRKVLRYPTLRDMARRFDVDVAQLSRWAKKRNIDFLRGLADAARRGVLEGTPEPAVVEEAISAAKEAQLERVQIFPGLDEAPEPSAEEPAQPTPEPKPGQDGRPAVTDAPRYSPELLDALLVYGEPKPTPNGTIAVHYPAQKIIAERLGIARSTVSTHWRKHDCGRRRAEARARIAARVEQRLEEETAQHIAISHERTIAIVDKFLARFEQALDDGTARTDLPSDFEKMARLKQLLLGEADSRSEVHQTLSLEAAQRQHAQILHDIDDASPAEMGLVIDTTGVELPRADVEVLTFDKTPALSDGSESPRRPEPRD